MGDLIYGVDLDGEITPLMVRDAIIRCFTQAHKEILDKKYKDYGYDSTELEGFEKIQIDLIVTSTFEDAEEDFENPTKEGIKKVLKLLAEFASEYREPEIIGRHYDEIMKLVDRLK